MCLFLHTRPILGELRKLSISWLGCGKPLHLMIYASRVSDTPYFGFLLILESHYFSLFMHWVKLVLHCVCSFTKFGMICDMGMVVTKIMHWIKCIYFQLYWIIMHPSIRICCTLHSVDVVLDLTVWITKSFLHLWEEIFNIPFFFSIKLSE